VRLRAREGPLPAGRRCSAAEECGPPVEEDRPVVGERGALRRARGPAPWVRTRRYRERARSGGRRAPPERASASVAAPPGFAGGDTTVAIREGSVASGDRGLLRRVMGPAARRRAPMSDQGGPHARAARGLDEEGGPLAGESAHARGVTAHARGVTARARGVTARSSCAAAFLAGAAGHIAQSRRLGRTSEASPGWRRRFVVRRKRLLRRCDRFLSLRDRRPRRTEALTLLEKAACRLEQALDRVERALARPGSSPSSHERPGTLHGGIAFLSGARRCAARESGAPTEQGACSNGATGCSARALAFSARASGYPAPANRSPVQGDP
jgi:hypothetical protein